MTVVKHIARDIARDIARGIVIQPDPIQGETELLLGNDFWIENNLVNPWINPSNLLSENGLTTDASVTMAQSQSNTNGTLEHGFIIPSNATVKGVEAKVRSRSNISGVNLRLRLTFDGPPTSLGIIKDIILTDSFDVYTVGGSNDRWDNGVPSASDLDAAIVNNDAFGVGIFIQYLDTDFSVLVDYIKLKVYYEYFT